MNYFHLLNIEQKFTIDLELLNKNYLNCLAKSHPDTVNATKEKKSLQANSAEINQAYQTLKDDLSRAEYLLSLNNRYIDDTKSLIQDKLVNIWEALEIVENTEDPRILEKLYREKVQNKELLIKEIAQAFESNNLEEALDITISLKYIINLINNIKRKLSIIS